jgi:hypothetical protein
MDLLTKSLYLTWFAFNNEVHQYRKGPKFYVLINEVYLLKRDLLKRFYCTSIFPTSHSLFLQETECTIDANVKHDILCIYEVLYQLLRSIFHQQMRHLVSGFETRSSAPFQCLLEKKMEQFLELPSNGEFQLKFSIDSIIHFWAKSKSLFPDIANRALKKILAFATTYSREAGLSRYIATKTKYRSKLNAKPDMRIQLSNIKPNMKHLCSSHHDALTSTYVQPIRLKSIHTCCLPEKVFRRQNS